MAQSDWITTGLGNAVQKGQEAEASRQYGPDRYWIPTGKSRELVFVDVEAGAFREHNYKKDGDWKNWLTCAAPLMDAGEVAPCCAALGADSAYLVSMLTIVDCDKWTDKKGNTRQYELKAYPAKFKTAQKLERKHGDLAKEGKALSGRLYRVTRETDKSPSVGDDFEYVRDVDMEKLFSLVTYKGKKLAELFAQAESDEALFAKLARTFQVMKGPDGKIPRKLVPFNYQKLYWPKTPAEIKAILTGYKKPDDDDRDSKSSGSSKGADEEVPF